MKIKKGVPCVYFISDGQGHCKIGVASDIKARFNTIQVGCAYDLSIKHIIYCDTLDEAYDIEKQYHSALKDFNIRGEWYNEDAVENYYNFKTVESSDKIYMCDVCPEFNLADAFKLYMIIMESKTPEEAYSRYNKEMPQYWKDYDLNKWIEEHPQ